MEEWDPAINDFVLGVTASGEQTKTNILGLSREKYYCEGCLSMFDNLCHC